MGSTLWDILERILLGKGSDENDRAENEITENEYNVNEYRENEYGENDMHMIVGLGNPTAKYKGTRHNVGFETVDYLSEKYGIALRDKKHKAFSGSGFIEGEKVLLTQPQTFMNLSGESVRALSDYYKVEAKNIIIIMDDIDLPVGQLRIRERGSAGGHNGMKNIIQHMGTQDIPRIRVGVGGKPEGWDLADYVLSAYSSQERKIMDEAVERAAQAAVMIARGDIIKAMNTFNIKASPE